MVSPNSRLIENSVTKGYLLAVLIIAVLATGAFGALQFALKDSESTALVVNISGKQRMLSQRIALHANHVYQYKTNPVQLSHRKAAARLANDASEMAGANKRLNSGQLTDKKFMELSSEVAEMYFGEMNLAQRVQDYTALAMKLAVTHDVTDMQQIITQIDDLSNDLLVDLNKVVQQYQIEGEARLEQVKSLETFIWMFTLFALFLEVVFIFRPLAKRVQDGVKLEQTFRQQLQDQVELRTLKLENTNQKLAKLASYDPLTEIKNRLTFEQDIEVLVNGYRKHKQDFAVVITDLDWFKKVNDQLGHDYGDYVIKTYAGILKDQIRQSDEVYRIGGEEFVILFNRIPLEPLLQKLESLKVLVQNYAFQHDDKQMSITASFGVYHSSLFELETEKEALKAADGALYKAKADGRNRVNLANKKHVNITNTVKENTMELMYADTEFQNLISVNLDKECQFSGVKEKLLTGEITLQDLVYEKDCDLLEDMLQLIQTEMSIFKTLRLSNAENHVVITRVEMLHLQDGIQVVIRNAADLANNVNDDVIVRNFHAMMENTNDFIYFKDRNHVFTAASNTLVGLTNVNNREELVGKTDYQVFPKDLADEYFILEKHVFNGDVEVSQKYQPFVDEAGNQGWVDNRKYPIKNFQGEIIGLFGIARVISLDEYQSALMQSGIKL